MGFRHRVFVQNRLPNRTTQQWAVVRLTSGGNPNPASAALGGWRDERGVGAYSHSFALGRSRHEP